MTEFFSVVLLLVGTAFVVVGSLGMARLPDTYCRLHATSKAVTLGMAGLLASAALYFDDPAVTAKCLLTLVFYFITSPTAAHLAARAAHRLEVPVWGEDVTDEYEHSPLAWHVPDEHRERRRRFREPDAPPSA